MSPRSTITDPNIDFQNKPDNLEIHFSEENIAAACSFVGEAAKFVLNINLKKPSLLIHESLHDIYNYTSILLEYLAIRSDWSGFKQSRILFS